MLALHPRSWAAIGLVVLVALACGARWAGLGAQLPHDREADTAMVHYAAFFDRPAEVVGHDAAYASTVYPLLLARTLVVLPGRSYTVAAPPGASIDEHLSAAAAPYVRARALVMLLSLLAIPATYFLARRWFEPGWSLFAAALVATSLLAASLAPIAKPHAVCAGFCAVALAALVRLTRDASVTAYAFAGTSVGLALGSLQTGTFLLPTLVLAHVCGWRADRRPARWIGLLVAAVPCAAAAHFAYAYLLFADPLRESGEQTLNFGQQAIRWDSWGMQGFFDMVPAMLSFDPALVVLTGAGVVAIVVALGRGRVARADAFSADVVVVASFAAIVVLLFGFHERFFARYFLPILPLFALVATCGARWIARLAPRPGVRVAIAAVLLAFPAYVVARYSVLRARDDTPTLAARWIERHVDPTDGPIAVDCTISLPMLQTSASLRSAPAWWWRPWQRYQHDLMPPGADGERHALTSLYARGALADRRLEPDEVRRRLAEIRPRWAVVAVPGDVDAAFDATCATVRASGGESRASFLPYPAGSDPDRVWSRDADPRLVLRVLTLDRLGPAIEVHRLPDGQEF